MKESCKECKSLDLMAAIMFIFALAASIIMYLLGRGDCQ